MTKQFPPHRTSGSQTAAIGTLRAQQDTPWSAWSDEDLLVRYARQGTREAFEELVHRYERELYQYLRKYIGNAQLAEDAFQMVFLQVHLKCREFDPQRRFRPWLYRIATTRAIDLLRRNRRWSAVRLGVACGTCRPGEDGPAVQEIADTRTTDPGQRLEADEDREKLRLLVDSLPASLRDVVVLIVHRALPYRKAAELLDIPLGTAKSRFHEAMQRLRRLSAAAA